MGPLGITPRGSGRATRRTAGRQGGTRGPLLYAAVSVAEYLIEGRLREALGRRSMDRTIQALECHVIVCGFGRLGRVVVEQLEQAGTSVW